MTSNYVIYDIEMSAYLAQHKKHILQGFLRQTWSAKLQRDVIVNDKAMWWQWEFAKETFNVFLVASWL